MTIPAFYCCPVQFPLFLEIQLLVANVVMKLLCVFVSAAHYLKATDLERSATGTSRLLNVLQDYRAFYICAFICVFEVCAM